MSEFIPVKHSKKYDIHSVESIITTSEKIRWVLQTTFMQFEPRAVYSPRIAESMPHNQGVIFNR